MATRSEVEAILPDAADEIYRMLGIYPRGLAMTGKDGGLALSVTLHKPAKTAYPECVLGVPTVFRVVGPAVFLNQAPVGGKVGN